MSALTKIYIGYSSNSIALATATKTFDSDLEFISKDALIKWLEEQRNEASSRDEQFDPNAIVEYDTYQKVIDKLNEM